MPKKLRKIPFVINPETNKRFWVSGRGGLYTDKGNFLPAPFGLPSEIVIAGHPWRVWYHTALYSKPVANPTYNIHGITCLDERIIVIDPTKVSRPEVVVTLYHELAHAHFEEWRRQAVTGADNRILDSIDPLTEEALVEMFARMMISLPRFF